MPGRGTRELPPDDILLQVTPALPLADVWRGLVEPPHLEKWLAPRVNVELREGGAFELFWDPEDPDRNSTRGCRILRLRSEEELAFSWKAPPPFDGLMNHMDPLTEVQIRVAPCPEGIDVTLEHRGWRAGPEWEEARSWHFHFWEETLYRFRDYLMTGEAPTPPRRERAPVFEPE
jgi:uncharacterized protein YndB with AHSA1/START domain